MSITKQLILIACLGYASGVLLLKFNQALQYDLSLMKQEGQCIKSYIAQGIERRDIKTNNGRCWIDRN